jgi:GNAT superfamily N-acetyltransferase
MAITFTPASEDDFEPLLALRHAAMRESLERLGRFDPDRARARFRASFSPRHTVLVHEGGAVVGCVTVRPLEDDAVWVEHLYLHPSQQGRGLGGQVMRKILDDADARGRTVRLAVLVQSDANRFYERLGFVETHREAWDIYYERRAASAG